MLVGKPSSPLTAPAALRTLGRILHTLFATLAVMAVMADNHLMFLHGEAIGMVAVFYARRTIVVIYPTFIAILILSIAVFILGRRD